MKKTLSLLLILGCGALHAVDDLRTAVAPIYHLDFEGTSAATGASLTNTGTSTLITAAVSSGYLNYKEEGYTGSEGYAYHNNSNYINVSLNGALGWASGFTVSMAVKADTLSTTAWTNIMSIGDATNHIRVQNSTTNGDVFGLYGAGTGTANTLGNVTDTSKSSISTSAYTLITLVYDVREDGGYFTLYSDGNLVSYSTTAFSTSASGPTTLSVGGNLEGNRYSSLHIDEVSIYDTALSQNDISTYLVNKPAGIIPEPATATLGLFAFAGLLGRRRRH